MVLTPKLYKKITDDLKKDFPGISQIKQDNNDIIVKADDDVLWEIFEVLFNGVENIEFNAKKDQEHYIIITI